MYILQDHVDCFSMIMIREHNLEEKKSCERTVPECRVYSFLARILRHENFVHGEIISHGQKIGERGVPNSHKLKTIRQISPWRDLIHL